MWDAGRQGFPFAHALRHGILAADKEARGAFAATKARVGVVNEATVNYHARGAGSMVRLPRDPSMSTAGDQHEKTVEDGGEVDPRTGSIAYRRHGHLAVGSERMIWRCSPKEHCCTAAPCLHTLMRYVADEPWQHVGRDDEASDAILWQNCMGGLGLNMDYLVNSDRRSDRRSDVCCAADGWCRSHALRRCPPKDAQSGSFRRRDIFTQ